MGKYRATRSDLCIKLKYTSCSLRSQVLVLKEREVFFLNQHANHDQNRLQSTGTREFETGDVTGISCEWRGSRGYAP